MTVPAASGLAAAGLKKCHELPSETLEKYTQALKEIAVRVGAEFAYPQSLTAENFLEIITELKRKYKDYPKALKALNDLEEQYCYEEASLITPAPVSAGSEDSATLADQFFLTPSPKLNSPQGSFRFAQDAWSNLSNLLQQSVLKIEDIPVPRGADTEEEYKTELEAENKIRRENGEVEEEYVPFNEQETAEIHDKNFTHDSVKAEIRTLETLKNKLKATLQTIGGIGEKPDVNEYVYNTNRPGKKPLLFNDDEITIIANALLKEMQKLDLTEDDLKDYVFKLAGSRREGGAQIAFSNKVTATQYQQIVDDFNSYFGEIPADHPLKGLKEARLQAVIAEITTLKARRAEIKLNPPYPLPLLEGVDESELKKYLEHGPAVLPKKMTEDEKKALGSAYIFFEEPLDPRTVAQYRASRGDVPGAPKFGVSENGEDSNDIFSFPVITDYTPINTWEKIEKMQPVIIRDNKNPNLYWVQRTDVGPRWAYGIPLVWKPWIDYNSMEEFHQFFERGHTQCKGLALDNGICNYFDIHMARPAERLYQSTLATDPDKAIERELWTGFNFAVPMLILGSVWAMFGGGGGHGGGHGGGGSRPGVLRRMGSQVAGLGRRWIYGPATTATGAGAGQTVGSRGPEQLPQVYPGVERIAVTQLAAQTATATSAAAASQQAAASRGINWTAGAKTLFWGTATIIGGAATFVGGVATAGFAMSPFDGPAGELAAGNATLAVGGFTVGAAATTGYSFRNFVNSFWE